MSCSINIRYTDCLTLSSVFEMERNKLKLGHSLSDKIALAGIKIVDRTASLGQLPEFRFRCQMIGSFVFGLFYSIILCPL